jgi:hypothetical protein
MLEDKVEVFMLDEDLEQVGDKLEAEEQEFYHLLYNHNHIVAISNLEQHYLLNTNISINKDKYNYI